MLVLDINDKIQGDATVAAEVDYTIHGTDNNTPVHLANGQLPDSKGDLFTSSGKVIISTIILVNTGALANVINLYITEIGGTSRRLIPVDLSLASGAALIFNINGLSYQILS